MVKKLLHKGFSCKIPGIQDILRIIEAGRDFWHQRWNTDKASIAEGE